MKTLDRYLAATFLKNFAAAVVGLTLLYIFQALLGELLDHNYETNQIVFYNLMKVPDVLVQMTPPSVLMATVLTLSGLNRSNELVAIFSIGISLWRIMLVILSLVFMISCLMLVMQDRILPPVYKKRTTYYWRDMKKRTDFFLDVKKDKIWYRSKNLIYNLKRFELSTNTIFGMSVYSFDEKFNLVQWIEAKKATYDINGWTLRDGVVTVMSAQSDSPFPQTRRFDEKRLMIAEKPSDFQGVEQEVDGLRLKELFAYIDRTQESGTDTKAIEVKFHSRISLSFIPLVMCILGVPFSVRNRRQGGLAKDLGLCLGLTFFYWLFYSIGLSLGMNGAVPPILAAWLPSMVFSGVAGLMISRLEG